MVIPVFEREFLRKRVASIIPQFKKSDIVHHFVQEDIARSTVYNTIIRLETNKKTGGPSNWSTTNNTTLKRLTNYRIGVSQRQLGNFQ